MAVAESQELRFQRKQSSEAVAVAVSEESHFQRKQSSVAEAIEVPGARKDIAGVRPD